MGSSAKVLLVEDEKDLAEPMLRSLREDGFEASHAASGEDARRQLEKHWDLVILDLMLPDMPGESILAYLRQRIDYPNVLVLTAKTGLQEKLHLFRLGCDDYLTKPFIYDELLMRVQALLRRARRVTAEDYRYHDLRLDVETSKLCAGDGAVTLTPKELSICRLLLATPEQIVPRKEILNSVWGLKEEPESNFIGVHIFNLRKKFAQLGRGEWFMTIRSTGYLVTDPASPGHAT